MVEETDLRLAREAYEAEQKERKAKERAMAVEAGTLLEEPEEEEAATDAPNQLKEDTKRRGKETNDTFRLTTKGKVRKSKQSDK